MDYSELLFANAVRERGHQFMRQAAKAAGQDYVLFEETADAGKYLAMAVEEAKGIAKFIRANEAK